MKAMVLTRIVDLEKERAPLSPAEVPVPEPGPGEILLRVTRCGVCHTELDEIEGRTPPPRLPVIPGHQVVGRVVKRGKDARRHREGDRLGVGWIYDACGQCSFCREGRENLCAAFRATGRDVDGGYGQYMNVPENHAHPIPEVFSDSEAAPLLCAGAIGHRSLALSGLRDGQNLGLTGFGASAHLVLHLVRETHPRSSVFVFARSEKERDFARELGAVWAGDTADPAPEKLHAVIDTTPAWKPVVEALRNLERGGRLVINAIRKDNRDREELLRVDYPEHLWMEKEIKSVANVTGKDIAAFLATAAEIPIRPTVEEFDLERANEALGELKNRKIRGAKVLKIP